MSGSFSLSIGKLVELVETYFGSQDNIFALLRAQPASNVVVSKALGVTTRGNRVPESKEQINRLPSQHIY